MKCDLIHSVELHMDGLDLGFNVTTGDLISTVQQKINDTHIVFNQPSHAMTTKGHSRLLHWDGARPHVRHTRGGGGLGAMPTSDSRSRPKTNTRTGSTLYSSIGSLTLTKLAGGDGCLRDPVERGLDLFVDARWGWRAVDFGDAEQPPSAMQVSGSKALTRDLPACLVYGYNQTEPAYLYLWSGVRFSVPGSQRSTRYATTSPPCSCGGGFCRGRYELHSENLGGSVRGRWWPWLPGPTCRWVGQERAWCGGDCCRGPTHQWWREVGRPQDEQARASAPIAPNLSRWCEVGRRLAWPMKARWGQARTRMWRWAEAVGFWPNSQLFSFSSSFFILFWIPFSISNFKTWIRFLNSYLEFFRLPNV
jgi:hypothetical protein